MLGVIVGDIVGSIYEHRNIKTKDFPRAVDLPRFFRLDPSGSTTFSSIQNFALTVP